MQGDRSKGLFGITVITAGIILLLNNLEVTNINLLPWWPVLIIIWGLSSLIGGSRNLGAQGISLFVIVLGAVLLSQTLGMYRVDLGRLFAIAGSLLVILVGLSMFMGHSFAGKSTVAILGGVERGKNAPWELESGSYFAFMGGVELDLRHAVIREGETYLDLTAVMGGIEVRVPADLAVVADGFAVMGGVDFFGKGSGGLLGSTRNEQGMSNDSKRVLKVQARAFIGGVELKRV